MMSSLKVKSVQNSMKNVLSEKNSLYYQEKLDFIRKKQNQHYLEKSNSAQKLMSEHKI